MKKIFITASVICLFLSAKAQFTYDYLRAADEYYRKGDYYSAAQYYEKYLSTNGASKGAYDPYVVKSVSLKEKKEVSGKEQAVYNLAESYRQLHFYVKAEPYYQQATAFDDATFPLADYHYATTLRALGKFEEAAKAFQQFLDAYKTIDKYTEATNREIQNLRYIQAQMKKKDLDQYKITGAPAFTSEGANYAPVWASPNTVYFTTTRPDGSAKKEHLNKVYEASYENGAFATAGKVALNQPSEIHQGGASVSADGNTMYVTRWAVGKGKKTAAIYRSQKTGSAWSEPVALNDRVNAAKANNKQPMLMPDGKLLFASDREGGQGGFDIYVADVNEGGEATNVTNLGATINTGFNEEAPYYHPASNTLVFSTDGRVGMGGYDLFFTQIKAGQWSEPQNFGYPVNSIKNDMYFASRGRAGNILADALLSSDRSAECCMQLFTVSKTQPLKAIAGTVVDCKTAAALAGASVEVKGAGNQTVFTGSTTTGGGYSFSMQDVAPLQIRASLAGYMPGSIRTAEPQNEEAASITVPVLCLNKIPEVGTVEVLENVYFAFNKAVVLEESFAALDKLAQMLTANPSVSVEISGHTDSKGDDTYNQKLSQNRAKSVVDYLISKGIERSLLVAKGYGETAPVAPNTNDDGSDNEEGREKNRRTEFKVIKN